MTGCLARAGVTKIGTRPQESVAAIIRAEIGCNIEVESLLGPHVACVSDSAETGSLHPAVGRSELG